MNLGTAQIIQGNALNLPLPDNSVDLICTSPPYFGLRSYQDSGAHYEGQLGSEATPAEFLDALLAATREMVRVLKPSGSIFVNLGDKYAADGPSGPRSLPPPAHGTAGKGNAIVWANPRKLGPTGIPTKSLMGIPWRYALACIDQLGLILRAEIIWAKPNGLPESVTDRVRRSHEQWFHFTVQPRYFSAVDEIRESYDQTPGAIAKRRNGQRELATYASSEHNGILAQRTADGIRQPYENPLGKLPGSVWTIPTQPLTVPAELGVDHFAAYPMEWPRRIIQGWTPNGICTSCGEGRRPTTDKKPMEWRPGPKADGYAVNGATRKVVSGTMLSAAETTITGYLCACTAGLYEWVGPDDVPHVTNNGTCMDCGANNHPLPATTPAVCLDPFGGTGTTALVAKALGRIGITIDLSADYCRLAEWRCNDPRELAAALQVEKSEPVHPDQLDLFSEAP